jgi:hypothetical protein
MGGNLRIMNSEIRVGEGDASLGVDNARMNDAAAGRLVQLLVEWSTHLLDSRCGVFRESGEREREREREIDRENTNGSLSISIHYTSSLRPHALHYSSVRPHALH